MGMSQLELNIKCRRILATELGYQSMKLQLHLELKLAWFTLILELDNISVHENRIAFSAESWTRTLHMLDKRSTTEL